MPTIDPEKRKTIRRRWQAKNRDRLHQEARQRYADNPDRRKAYFATYRAGNKDRARAYKKRYVAENKEKIRAGERRRLYGIASGRAEGFCDICRRHTKSIQLDHNHLTGSPRGWLCRRCNQGLGYLEDTLYMLSAIHYLRGRI